MIKFSILIFKPLYCLDLRIGRSWSSEVPENCPTNEEIKQMWTTDKTQGENRIMFPFTLPQTLELVQQSHSCICGNLV